MNRSLRAVLGLVLLLGSSTPLAAGKLDASPAPAAAPAASETAAAPQQSANPGRLSPLTGVVFATHTCAHQCWLEKQSCYDACPRTSNYNGCFAVCRANYETCLLDC